MALTLLNKRKRKTKATWWAQDTDNGVIKRDNYGLPILAAAVEVDVFWIDRLTKIVGPNGEDKLSRATVTVDRTMTTGDLLWEGALADADTDNPRENAGSSEIQRVDNYNNTGGLRGATTDQVNIVYL